MDKRLELVEIEMSPNNTERCCVCKGSGCSDDMPGLPCLNCDGTGYIYPECSTILGLYGKVLQ